MTRRPLIAAVHNTTVSIPPLRAALAQELHDATLWNLIDDRLGVEADPLNGNLNPRLRDRMLNLVRHAVTGGADAVVLACSMYGDVRFVAEKLIEVPVFASDTDMMSEIAAAAPRRVAVLASLQGAATDTTARLTAALSSGGEPGEVVPVFCADAAEAAIRSDTAALVDLFASELGGAAVPFDMVCIAQYSLSPAGPALADKMAIPVATPPASAARAVAHRLAAS